MGVPSKVWRKVARKTMLSPTERQTTDFFLPAAVFTLKPVKPFKRPYWMSFYSTRALLHKCSMLWTVFAIQLIGVPATSSKAGDIEVEIKMPKEVKVGSSVELRCEWRLYGKDGLYSVKWYKDDHEFFRYVPDNNPGIRTFPQPGINVDRRQSNDKSIRLRDIGAMSSGQYKCEVSTEAPSFATTYSVANLTVIAMPEQGPEITGLSSRYSVGDNVTANCTTWPSVPRTTVRWLVNEKPIAREKTIQYPETKSRSSVGLRMQLEPYLLQGATTTVAVKCIAQIGSNALQTEQLLAIVYANNQRLSSENVRAGAAFGLEPIRLSVAALSLLFHFVT